MRRILKRILRRDESGRILQEFVELAQDDGTDARFDSVETLQICESCLRPLRPDEERSSCDICRRRTCSCRVSCAACARSLCGECRCGVATEKGGLTVCPLCLPEVRRIACLSVALAIENLRMKLIQSPLMDPVHGGGILGQLAGLSLLRRLRRLQRGVRQ